MGDLTADGLDEVVLAATDVGTATHALIALLAARRPWAGGEDVLSVGRRLLVADRLGVPNRQAFRARVLSQTAVYFDRFARPGWRLVGAEVVVGGDVALDLLWERGARLQADEIKTGRLRLVDRPVLQAQCRAQLQAGREEFGEGFEAVRAVVLARPDWSFEVQA